MNKKDYIESLEGQLNSVHVDDDGTTHPYYVEAKQEEIREVQRRIRWAISEGVENDYISESDGKYMDPPDKPGRLYGLPKVHKQVKEGEKLPPLRPVISNSGSTTEQLSRFIDEHAKEEVRKMDSYVQDTPDLLRQFQNENNKGPQKEGTFPVTVDIVNMYGNIPTHGEDGGLQAFEKALDKRSDQTVPTKLLVSLLILVLDNNIFEFCGKLWRQMIGTAMGTVCAPTYANLFCGWLETQRLLGKWMGTTPHMWRRYIDDILFLWTGTEEELKTFGDHLNAQHPYIKFTMSYDMVTKSVPFLDMQVTVNDQGYIETDLYKKETAKCQYLLPSSCHPGHICRNIPFSLGYRLLRICSAPEKLKVRLQELKADLISRSYKIKIIDEAFERLNKIQRSEAIKKVTKEASKRSPLVLTYHPGLPSVSSTIRKHHGVMIDEDPRLRRCFPQPSVVAYKREKSLRDILVRAKITKGKTSQRPKSGGFKPCQRMCIMCALTEQTNSHRNTRSGETWMINAPLTCETKGCIYRLTCRKNKCKDFLYIGETGKRACDRFQQHRGYVT